MTEITRVPLQPIAKGALPKLWIGVAALALAAGGIAWSAMTSWKLLKDDVLLVTIEEGQGLSPTRSDVALVNYKGTLADGTVFDEGEQSVFPLAEVIPGFTTALEQMQRGGKYRIEIPADLGYGDEQVGDIPAGSDLTFEVELIDFKSRAEIEQQQRMIEQLQRMQQGPGGPPQP